MKDKLPKNNNKTPTEPILSVTEPVKKKRGRVFSKEECIKGGNNKKGKKHDKTIAQEQALEEYKQRMVGSMMKITEAQLMMSLGAAYLFRIDKVMEGKKVIEKRPVLVTDRIEMEDFLENYVNGKVELSEMASYYYLVAKDPDTKAINDILDRLYGKARQTSEVTFKKSIADLFDEIEEEDEE